jgi:Protein of unknown function (DUF3667)
MSDEATKIILGDTAISAGEQPPRAKRFFGRKKAQRAPLSHCENCGTLLTGRFCGHCGQPAIDYRRSFRHVIVDVLDSFLNWDSKFIATIGYLLTRPWKLTNEFLAGHRVRYLNPLRLYLLASVLFFFVVNYAARQAERNSDFEPVVFDDETKFTPGEVHEPKPDATPPIDKTDESGDDESPPLVIGSESRSPTGFEEWLQQKIEEKIGKHGSKGKFFLRSLMENLPYMMLASIPLFAFVLKMLYIFRHKFYIDHLIYALHIHSFAYLATLVIWGIGLGLSRVYPPLLPLVLFLLIPTVVIQIFLSIRKVYLQGWIATFFKFGLGAFAYFFVLLLALAATFFVTLVAPN